MICLDDPDVIVIYGGSLTNGQVMMAMVCDADHDDEHLGMNTYIWSGFLCSVIMYVFKSP